MLYLPAMALIAVLCFGGAALLWIRRRWYQMRGRSLPLRWW